MLQAFNRRVPFAFLEDIKTRFTTAHGTAATNAPAYAFNHTFAPILQQRAAYHSNPINDTVSRVTGEVSSLREVMVENIERVLERGDRLELLVQKTDDLDNSAFVFKRGATTLKREMWYRNIRTSVYVVLLVILGLYILAALMCSPTLKHC
jgi:vesicle-associated membrane protein 7